MRVLELKNANLSACVRAAQDDRVVLVENGKPVALLVGVQGMDLDQLELSTSKKFWDLIKKCRDQPSLSRAELERRMGDEGDGPLSGRNGAATNVVKKKRDGKK